MAEEKKKKVEGTEMDLSMEARKVKALEKIALNLEGLVMFFEDLDADEWDQRLQWYLSLAKKAFIDPKLEELGISEQ